MSIASTHNQTQINGLNIELDAPVTASGDISASGTGSFGNLEIAGSGGALLEVDGDISASGLYITGTGGAMLEVAGDISASGDFNVGGDLYFPGGAVGGAGHDYRLSNLSPIAGGFFIISGSGDPDPLAEFSGSADGKPFVGIGTGYGGGKIPKTLTVAGDISASGAMIHNVHTFADGDLTPDVSNGYMFKTANTSGTDITGFDGGSAGQEIVVFIQDINTDFTNGTNLVLYRGSDFDGAATNDILKFVCLDGTKWLMSSSQNNT
jgi:hypothetical protein